MIIFQLGKNMVCFQTGLPYVDQTGLHLRSACLCLLGVGIKGMPHHAQQFCFFKNEK